jgi:hypothetical protein
LAQADDDKSDPRGLFIQMNGPLLTVKATEIPHNQILKEIAKQLNFELIIHGPLQEQRSLDLQGRPWKEVLKKALFPASWAFVYKSTAGEPRLTKVFVLSPQWDIDTTGDPPATSGPPDTPSSASTQSSKVQAVKAPEPELKGMNTSLTELLQDRDEYTRMVAVGTIAAIGGEKAVDTLKHVLQDKEPWIRAQAVEALIQIGGEQAIEGIRQALQDEHPYVQQVAQEGLALFPEIRQ